MSARKLAQYYFYSFALQQGRAELDWRLLIGDILKQACKSRIKRFHFQVEAHFSKINAVSANKEVTRTTEEDKPTFPKAHRLGFLEAETAVDSRAPSVSVVVEET